MNETDIYRDSALHVAAKKGHEKIISFLLNKCDENRETALHIAAYKGNQGIFRLLLAAPGQNSSARNRLGCTALHIAAECCHKPIIKQLLALPNIDLNATDINRDTPLSLTDNNSIRLLFLAEDNIDVNITGSGQHSRSALHRAIEQKDRGTIALLLQRPELNPNVYNHIDWTPLYDTVSNRDLQIVELLLTRADLEVNTPRYPPLFYTAQRRHLNIVKQLIKVKGIDINLRFYGLSPLQASIKFEHMDIAKVLQTEKAKIMAKNSRCL